MSATLESLRNAYKQSIGYINAAAMRAICGGEMDQLHRDLLDEIERLKSAEPFAITANASSARE